MQTARFIRKFVFGVACAMTLACPRALLDQAVAASKPPAASPASVPAEIEKAMQLPDGKEKIDAIGAALKSWSQNDPTAGLAWLLAKPPRLYGQLRGNVASFADGADPGRSADWLVQQGSRPALDYLHVMLTTWARTDSNAATAWCAGLQSKDARAREVSFYSVADGLCRKKPELAAAWAAKVQAAEDRLSAVGGTTTIWARADIVAATAWIKTLGPPELKRAAQVVVAVWSYAKGTKASPNTWRNVQEWLDQTSLGTADKEFVLKNPKP
jgi:hypothetical protein